MGGARARTRRALRVPHAPKPVPRSVAHIAEPRHHAHRRTHETMGWGRTRFPPTTTRGPWPVRRYLLTVAAFVLAAASHIPQPASAIFGGAPRPLDAKYPYAAVVCSTIEDRGDRPIDTRRASGMGYEDSCHAICSGSLIAPGVVLTGAHCFHYHPQVARVMSSAAEDGSNDFTMADNFRVMLGGTHGGLHNKSEGVGVSRIVIPSEFNFIRGSSVWNLALLFLDACQTDTEPIKLWAGNATAAGPAHVEVVGFGDSEEFCVT